MILLSVKPYYADAILNLRKIIELRRKIGISFKPNTKIYLYASSPVKAIVGTAYLKSVEKVALCEATHKKNNILNRACITKPDFDRYFLGSDFCYFLHIESVKKAKAMVSLKDLRKIYINPPQSFCYLIPEKIKIIDSLLEEV